MKLRRPPFPSRRRSAASAPVVEDLLSTRRIDEFDVLLDAFRALGRPLRDALDGGAGEGWTANKMLPCIEGEIYAFEPFPGNHRFFDELDPRIKLIPSALAEAPKTAKFNVGSVVTEEQSWGKKGKAGYSSVGRLVGEDEEANYTVECVRADDVIPPEAAVDFIKLDLQGGELNALRGMERLLDRALFVWMEFTGRDSPLPYLHERGYRIFDTEYLLVGEPTDAARDEFEVSHPGFRLSTDRPAWKGYRRKAWDPYQAGFERARQRFGLVQTDLVCVHRDRLAEFEEAVRFLDRSGGR